MIDWKVEFHCGDIILFARPCAQMDALSAVICYGAKYLTWQNYDHIGMVVQDPSTCELYLLEANMNGVTCHNLEERLKRTKSSEIAVRKLMGNIDDNQKRMMWELAMNRVQEGSYNSNLLQMTCALVSSYMGSIDPSHKAGAINWNNNWYVHKKIVAPLLYLNKDTHEDKIHRQQDKPSNAPGKYYCSHLVADMLQHVGILHATKPTMHYLPADFSSSVYIKNVYFSNGFSYSPNISVKQLRHRDVVVATDPNTKKVALIAPLETQVDHVVQVNTDIRSTKYSFYGHSALPESVSEHLLDLLAADQAQPKSRSHNSSGLSRAKVELQGFSHWASTWSRILIQPLLSGAAHITVHHDSPAKSDSNHVENRKRLSVLAKSQGSPGAVIVQVKSGQSIDSAIHPLLMSNHALILLSGTIFCDNSAVVSAGCLLNPTIFLQESLQTPSINAGLIANTDVEIALVSRKYVGNRQAMPATDNEIAQMADVIDSKLSTSSRSLKNVIDYLSDNLAEEDKKMWMAMLKPLLHENEELLSNTKIYQAVRLIMNQSFVSDVAARLEEHDSNVKVTSYLIDGRQRTLVRGPPSDLDIASPAVATAMMLILFARIDRFASGHEQRRPASYAVYRPINQKPVWRNPAATPRCYIPTIAKPRPSLLAFQRLRRFVKSIC